MVVEDGLVQVVGFGGRRRLDVDLHVFAERAGVRVGLGAAQGFAVVGLGGRVDLRMLLTVAAVGEAPLAELALKRLLPWNSRDRHFICTQKHCVCECVYVRVWHVCNGVSPGRQDILMKYQCNTKSNTGINS